MIRQAINVIVGVLLMFYGGTSIVLDLFNRSNLVDEWRATLKKIDAEQAGLSEMGHQPNVFAEVPELEHDTHSGQVELSSPGESNAWAWVDLTTKVGMVLQEDGTWVPIAEWLAPACKEAFERGMSAGIYWGITTGWMNPEATVGEVHDLAMERWRRETARKVVEQVVEEIDQIAE